MTSSLRDVTYAKIAGKDPKRFNQSQLNCLFNSIYFILFCDKKWMRPSHPSQLDENWRLVGVKEKSKIIRSFFLLLSIPSQFWTKVVRHVSVFPLTIGCEARKRFSCMEIWNPSQSEIQVWGLSQSEIRICPGAFRKKKKKKKKV